MKSWKSVMVWQLSLAKIFGEEKWQLKNREHSADHSHTQVFCITRAFARLSSGGLVSSADGSSTCFDGNTWPRCSGQHQHHSGLHSWKRHLQSKASQDFPCVRAVQPRTVTHFALSSLVSYSILSHSLLPKKDLTTFRQWKHVNR